MNSNEKIADALEQTLRGHWVTCNPEWIKAGGNCATAPRILCGHGQGVSHMHPAHQPHGEVERLHSRLREEQAYVSELAGQNTALEKERDTLRAQLAEAHALLRKALADIEYIQKECGDYASPGYIGCLVDGVVELLSASAGPIAPIKMEPLGQPFAQILAENAEGLMLKAAAPKCETPSGLECPGDGVSECKACPGAPNPYWPAESAEELARFKEWMKTKHEIPR